MLRSGAVVRLGLRIARGKRALGPGVAWAPAKHADAALQPSSVRTEPLIDLSRWEATLAREELGRQRQDSDVCDSRERAASLITQREVPTAQPAGERERTLVRPRVTIAGRAR